MVILINICTNIIHGTTTTTQSAYEKAIAEILKEENVVKKAQEQLRNDQAKFEKEKNEMQRSAENTDVIQLNVGGDIMSTTRETLTRVPNSLLSVMFNGRWEQKLQIDQDNHIFFDYNPIVITVAGENGPGN